MTEKLENLDFMWKRYKERLEDVKEKRWESSEGQGAKRLGVEIRKLMIEIEKEI